MIEVTLSLLRGTWAWYCTVGSFAHTDKVMLGNINEGNRGFYITFFTWGYQGIYYYRDEDVVHKDDSSSIRS